MMIRYDEILFGACSGNILLKICGTKKNINCKSVGYVILHAELLPMIDLESKVIPSLINVKREKNIRTSLRHHGNDCEK